MEENVLIFVGKAVGNFVVKTVLEKIPYVYTKIRILITNWRGNKGPEDRNGSDDLREFDLNGLSAAFVVVEGTEQDVYKEGNIRCYYNSQKLEFPQDLKSIYDEISHAQEEAKREGDTLYWNAEKYGLSSFRPLRTESGNEDLILELWFRPSEYFWFLTTTRNLDRLVSNEQGEQITIRDKYINKYEWDEVAPFMVNGFGVAISIITSDNYIVFAERNSKGVGTWGGYFNASVNEGMTHEADKNEFGRPDPFKAVIRGTYEELKIEINKSVINFLTFGYETEKYQWGLQGMAKVPYTAGQIKKYRSIGPKDKGENKRLHFLNFNDPYKVIVFLFEKPWTPVGKVCVVYTLMNQYGRKKIEDLISKYLETKV